MKMSYEEFKAEREEYAYRSYRDLQSFMNNLDIDDDCDYVNKIFQVIGYAQGIKEGMQEIYNNYDI